MRYAIGKIKKGGEVVESYAVKTETDAFEKCLESFLNPIDIAQCFSRAKIFSYSPDAKKPVIFRHYKHPVENLIDANQHRGMRISQYTRISVHIQGKIRVLINDMAYNPSYGDIIIERKNDADITHYLKSEEIEYYEFEFPNEFFESSDGKNRFFPFIAGKEDEKHSLISPDQKEATMLFEILEAFDSEANNQSEYSDSILYSLLIRLGVLLSKMHKRGNHENVKDKIDPLVQKAITFISKNFISIAKIDEIAADCGISVSYLCRIFKTRLGITPTDYLNRIKINYAQKLLRSGANVTEACFDSGFNNYGYFITLFKKTIGTTPAIYKKQSV